MKKIILILFSLYSFAFGAVPFTVENIQNLRILLINHSDIVSKKQIENIKIDIQKNLEKHGINLKEIDPSTLVIIIETMEVNKINIANIQFIISEEVITRRKNDINTFAFTYYTNDFFEIEEKSDIKESVDILLEQFLELYEEDME